MIELHGHIDDAGKALIPNRTELTQWFADNAGKSFTLSVKVNRRNRSNPQNSYYWGVVVPTVRRAMNAYGNDFSTEETHEFLKAEFNWKEIEVSEGYYLKVPVSTTALNTLDFMEYVDKIKLFAAEMFSVTIPEPGEQITMNMEDDKAA